MTVDRLALCLQALFLTVTLCLMAYAVTYAWLRIALMIESFRHDQVMNRADEDKAQAQAALVWAQVTAAGPKVAEPMDEDIRVTMWKTRLKLLFQAANKLGWHIRQLCPNVLSANNWAWITGYLKECGVLTIDLSGTAWAPNYNLDRALSELASGVLPCPEIAPFDVAWGANSKQENALITGKTG
jgi:hypothetical protein